MNTLKITLIIGIAIGALVTSTVGVVAQSASPIVAAPVAFTGTASSGPCGGTSTTEVIGNVEQTRGGYCNPTYSFSDPRLNGTVTWMDNADKYLDGSGLVIESVAIRIENADGAWRQFPILTVEAPEGIEYDRTSQFLLVGEGGYAGLIAVGDGFMTGPMHGFIIEGALPDPPETAATQ